MFGENKFLANSFTYLFGSISISLLSVVSLAVMVHFLSVSEFGQFSILLQIATLASFFFGFQLSGYIVIEYNILGENSKDYASLMGTILLFIFIFSLLTISLFTLLFIVFDITLLEELGSEVKIIALFSGLFLALINFVNAYLMISERAATLVIFRIAKSMAFLVSLFIMLSIFNYGVTGAILAEATSAFVISSILLIGLVRKIGFSFNSKHIKSALAFSSPLIIHALAVWSLVASDRFVIEHFLDMDRVGTYSFAYTIASFLAMTMASIDNSWAPIFLEISEKNSRFSKVIGDYWTSYPLVLSLICIVFLSFAPFIINLLGGNEYKTSNNVMFWLVLGMFFQGLYMTFGKTIPMKKRTLLLASITIIVALFNLILTIILVPLLGIDGAAIATFISYMLLMLISLHFSQKIEKMELNYFQLSKHVGIFIMAICIISFLATEDDVLALFSGLFISLIIFVSGREEIEKLIQIQFLRPDSS